MTGGVYTTDKSKTLQSLADVDMDNLQNNQAPVYDATLEIFTNQHVATSTSPITANLGDVIIGDGASGITSTNKLFVDTVNSRVGIGTTTPTSKLDVRDTMRVSGDINFGSPLNDVTLSSIAYDNGTGGIDVKSYTKLGLYT